MKTLLVGILVIFSCFSLAGTSFTVDNNIRPTGQYSSWNAAYAVAAAGDTIYVYPSPYDYGTFNVTKLLTVIGGGLNPDDPEQLTSRINLYLGNGAAAAEGSIFNGLHSFYSVTNDYRVQYQHCQFDGQIHLKASDSVLKDCLFKSHVAIGNSSVVTGGYLITGCIFQGLSLKPQSNTDLVCYNCLFTDNDYPIDTFVGNQITCYLNNCLFVNSGTGYHALAGILSSPVSLNFINCIIETMSSIPAQNFLYCIYEGNSTYITGPGNQQSVNLAEVMVDVNGGDYHLIPGSLASGTGYDGADIGIYGGNNPFNDLWYLTSLPSVTDLICPPVIDPNGQLNVHIEVQCGN